jgi:hypothetical protein
MVFAQTNGAAQTCKGTEFNAQARDGPGDAEPPKDHKEDLARL